jgi:hypothetical protein
MSYADLLRDPRWQRKRLEALEAAQWMCSICYSKIKTLNVHHRFYRHGAKPWEYERDELEVLCEGCHELAHLCKKELARIGREGFAREVIHYLVATMDGGCWTLEQMEKLRSLLKDP